MILGWTDDVSLSSDYLPKLPGDRQTERERARQTERQGERGRERERMVRG